MNLSKKIKVLIVDDSVLFRTQLQKALGQIQDLEVVGTAKNGKIALEKIKELSPELCILDIEMPEMDGLTTLKNIKTLGYKTKVIMFSSHSLDGAEKTLDAMTVGAIDFLAKPSLSNINADPSELIKNTVMPKIKSIFKIGDYQALDPVPVSKIKLPKIDFNWSTFNPEILVIASSTGGPNALIEFFTELKVDVPFPIVIAQHMPPLFTASLAERLGRLSNKDAAEAKNGEILKANQIYVVPGDYHLVLTGTKAETIVLLNQGPHRNFVRPCADFLFESAANIYKSNVLSVVLTGMGRDGCDGALAVKEKNGAVLIQSQETCAVFGMPGAVYNTNQYDFIDSPRNIAKKVESIFKSKGVNHVA